MPYEMKNHHPQCPAGKPWAVVNKDTGRLEGCSPDRDAALEHMRALYANVPDASTSDRAADEAGGSLKAPIRGIVEERSATLAGVDWPSRTITVIAVPYEQETPVEYRGEMWHEVFSRSAFNGIDPRQRNIPVSTKFEAPSLGHGGARLVGKVSSANPIHSEGLLCETRISKTSAGDETLALAEDRALFPSVGFVSPGRDHVLHRPTMTRRINRAFLDHLSFVPQPAYAGARIIAMRAEDRDLEPLNTPNLDEILSDPVFNWANSQDLGEFGRLT